MLRTTFEISTAGAVARPFRPRIVLYTLHSRGRLCYIQHGQSRQTGVASDNGTQQSMVTVEIEACEKPMIDNIENSDDISKAIPHVLACDVGNSAIHFVHVHGDEVGEVRVLRHGDLGSLPQALVELWDQIPKPKKLVAASVNPTGLKALEAAAGEAIRQPVLVVGRDLPLPIDTDLPSPQTVGVDRLCAAAAAFDRLGVACVVVDLGTAITIDCVNEQGVFLGGAILAGVAMQANALHTGTAQLPLVEPTKPDWVFGKDTRQAIVGGLVFGIRGALREFVEAYATELGHWPLVILTGGDAELIGGEPSESELVQAIVPDLTLRGVSMAYYRSLLK